MSVIEFCTWLEGTPIALLVRETLWGFPIVVAVHILGLTMSAGTILWFDLRLLGLSMTRCPVATLYRRLIPWAIAGFAVMFVSGGMLVISYASNAYGNTYFRIKMAALLLAFANAAIYHSVTERRIADWNDARRPPLPARMAGLTSIVVWTIVILAGRMMSYTMF
jgi:hypothetical protein